MRIHCDYTSRIGTVHDAEVFCSNQVKIELNGVGDNPIFIPEEKYKSQVQTFMQFRSFCIR